MPIDLDHDLNPAQRQAALTTEGPVLVIAGAGSGKTRTIVYRLARLVENGVPPESILLLTFTRKAAQEMLTRAGALLGRLLPKTSGGTFHSFAYSILRRHAMDLGYPSACTVMDRGDAEDVLGEVRRELGVAPQDKTFPRRGAVLELLGKARNKEIAVEELLGREAPHLLPFSLDFVNLAAGYAAFKAERGLFDYDDLLFLLERLLTERPDTAAELRARYRYVMVDEYQDTNKVQARLVRLLAGTSGNVMAVGDDAQSIYAFRGADVENILRFPEDFPGTRIITLEENYRSTQPILDLANELLRQAPRKYEKHLHAKRDGGTRPHLFRPFSDFTQAELAVAAVAELAKSYPLHSVAVLFRAGYQSYALEIALNKARVAFQKFGGIKFSEAAHIKDVLCLLRLIQNPLDLPALTRCLEHVPGVGKRTAVKLNAALAAGNGPALEKATKRHPGAGELFAFLEDLRTGTYPPALLVERVMVFYTPWLMRAHPEDYPRRQAGIEQLAQIAAGYSTLDAFLAELALENPDEGEGGVKQDTLVLSTVHSAKGLEWDAVLLIDLVDDRFPSRHAMASPQDMEEERRLMYVACTRARHRLGLFAPQRVYQRQNGATAPASMSLFLRSMPDGLFDVWSEGYPGMSASRAPSLASPAPAGLSTSASALEKPRAAPHTLGYCRHKIFGQGKVIADLGEGKLRVNFQGFGPKVILADYLEMQGDPGQAGE
jgi:DNA helicase II / ATP-dependent DNA helicase PcrA